MTDNKPAAEPTPDTPAEIAESAAPRFDTLAPNFANDISGGFHPHGSVNSDADNSISEAN
jgi:hypothetical protein